MDSNAHIYRGVHFLRDTKGSSQLTAEWGITQALDLRPWTPDEWALHISNLFCMRTEETLLMPTAKQKPEQLLCQPPQKNNELDLEPESSDTRHSGQVRARPLQAQSVKEKPERMEQGLDWCNSSNKSEAIENPLKGTSGHWDSRVKSEGCMRCFPWEKHSIDKLSMCSMYTLSRKKNHDDRHLSLWV